MAGCEPRHGDFSRKRTSVVEFVNDEKNEGSDPRPFPWRFPNARRAERGHTTPGRAQEVVEGRFGLWDDGIRE